MICTMQFKGEVAAVCPDMDGAGRDSIQADLTRKQDVSMMADRLDTHW